MRPHLIITNDDGIEEPGIFHLTQALKPYFEVTVVAPMVQQSGKGLGITLHQPLKIQEHFGFDGIKAYKVSGTPADCVKVACSMIAKNTPALIVSGINPGDNSGRNALYSGTVGATIEGAMRGIPGIAFSCLDFDQPPFEAFAKYIPQICDYFIRNQPPFGTVINVNCPLKELGPIQGVKLARQGKSYWSENSTRLQEAPLLDYDHYLGASWQEHEEHDQSDIHLLKKGFITAAVIKIDELTDKNYFEKESHLFDAKFNSQQPSLI